jgi:hypothetical protein
MRRLLRASNIVVLLMVVSGCAGANRTSLLPAAPASRTTLAREAAATIHLAISGSPIAIAVQKGPTRGWQALPTKAKSFMLAGTTAYGVAYACPTGSTTNPNQYSALVVQATTSDFTTVPIECAQPKVGSLTVRLAYQPKSDYCPDRKTNQVVETIEVNGGASLGGCTAARTARTNLYAGTQDVFFAAFDQSNNLMAFRTLQGARVPGRASVTFGTADKIGPTKVVLQRRIPPGVTSETEGISFGSFGWWLAPLGSASGLAAAVSFPTVASAEVGANESYLIAAQAFFSGAAYEVTTYAFSQSAPTKFPVFPSQFTISAKRGRTPTFPLTYTGFAKLTGGIQAYGLYGSWSSAHSTGSVADVVTSSWLQAAGSSSYTIPNIAIANFPKTIAPPRTNYSWHANALYAPASFVSELPYGTIFSMTPGLPLPTTGPSTGSIAFAGDDGSFVTP